MLAGASSGQHTMPAALAPNQASSQLPSMLAAGSTINFDLQGAISVSPTRQPHGAAPPSSFSATSSSNITSTPPGHMSMQGAANLGVSHLSQHSSMGLQQGSSPMHAMAQGHMSGAPGGVLGTPGQSAGMGQPSSAASTPGIPTAQAYYRPKVVVTRGPGGPAPMASMPEAHRPRSTLPTAVMRPAMQR